MLPPAKRDQWIQLWRSRAADLLVTVLVIGVALADPPRGARAAADWQWALAVLLMCGALLLRRRSAVVACGGVLLVWAAIHTERAADDPGFIYLALAFSAYALGAHEPFRRGLPAAIALTGAVAAAQLLRDGSMGGVLQLALCFALGQAIRHSAGHQSELNSQATKLAAERAELTNAAVAQERARIARDLHDTVGHAVSLMILQTGAVLTRLEPHQESERATLQQAQRAGQSTVEDLRRMLGILRDAPEDALVPASLAAVDDLAAAVRGAGVDLAVLVHGEPDGVPRGVEVAGYRIIQEALTNVARHAPRSKATLTIQHSKTGLHITVADDGGGSALVAPGEPGHGLIGMRERVAAYAGTLTAGAGPDGGFVVDAWLPLRAQITPSS